MNAKNINRVLKNQLRIWDKLYKDSKSADAGLVASFIEDLQHVIECTPEGEGENTIFSDNYHIGGVACYGSESLKDIAFKA